MSFTINNTLAFIDSFQFLISSLDSLKLVKRNFKFKEKSPSKEKFYI